MNKTLVLTCVKIRNVKKCLKSLSEKTKMYLFIVLEKWLYYENDLFILKLRLLKTNKGENLKKEKYTGGKKIV